MFSKPALKRSFIYLIVGSLVASAGLGIWAIISGELNELDWKILLTTLVVGLFSVTSLLSLRTLESERLAFRAFSTLSILVSIAALLVSVLVIWTDWVNDSGESLTRLSGSLTVVAVASAHIILLLPFVARSAVARTLTVFTSIFISAAAGILLYFILRPWDVLYDNDDMLYRALAVFLILDVLGTILTPITAKFLSPAQPSPSSADSPAPPPAGMVIQPENHQT
jgi:hypothetical protein